MYITSVKSDLNLLILLICFICACEEQHTQIDSNEINDAQVEFQVDAQVDVQVDQETDPADQGQEETDIALQVDLGEIEQQTFPQRALPISTQELPRDDSYQWSRGLIHMHSVHSHDACDGNPKPDGTANQECLADLRAALCSSRLDYVLLTDHPDSFTEVTFEEACLFDASQGDELIQGQAGQTIGNRMRCPDGRTVLIAPGSEGEIMPVMLTRVPDQSNYYGTRSPEAVEGLKAAGALVLHAHTEQRTFSDLWPLGLDGFEIYNLHANVNPRGEQLREVIGDLTTTLRAGIEGAHPDLSLLAILRPNRWALDIWDLFLPHARALGFAGSDIHQNLPVSLFASPDGERLDSYRRLTQWFANYLLVTDHTLSAVREALVSGRLFTVFYLLGEPRNLDFYLIDETGTRHEMGSEIDFRPGLKLFIEPPEIPPSSQIEIKVYHISKQSAESLPGENVNKQILLTQQQNEMIEIDLNQAGAYRFEITLIPEHLRTELGSLANLLIRPTIWIYSNPIYVR